MPYSFPLVLYKASIPLRDKHLFNTTKLLYLRQNSSLSSPSP
jgi:hypothetical protein